MPHHSLQCGEFCRNIFEKIETKPQEKMKDFDYHEK